MTARAPLPGRSTAPVPSGPGDGRGAPAPGLGPGAGDVRLCRFPGCGRELVARNITGVCVQNLHRHGFCGCGRCPALRAPAPVAPRADVLHWRVRGVGYCSSSASRVEYVSLPAPPSAALAQEILK